MLPLPFPASTISLPYGAVDGVFYTAASPHQGTDFSSHSQGVVAGTIIPASGPGVVVRSGYGPQGVTPNITRPNALAGNSIDVDYGVCIARYMHRPDDSPSPAVGARVDEGSSLGVIGATGLVDAPHLHMETWDKATGRRVNPAFFFDFTRHVGDGTSSSTAAGGSASPFQPKEWDEMASKDEIKTAFREVLNEYDGAGLRVISYASAGNPRNGIALAAPGYWHKFTAEEWTQFNAHGMLTGVPVTVPVNDRDYDVIKAVYVENAAEK